MKIKEIELKNYRNYEYLKTTFSEFLNFIIGENASGKTNLLEAIGYFVLCRSFRGVNDSFLIRKGEKSFYIKLILQKDNEEHKYEIGYEKLENTTRKKIKKNDKKIDKISEILKDFLAVFFLPSDLELVRSIPIRRNFFDIFFSTIDDEYFRSYLEYHKCLEQRNTLLKRILEKKANIGELDFWDEKLIQNAIIIMKKRKKILESFNIFFYKRVKEISNQKDEVFLELQQPLEEDFEKLFKDSRYNDIYSGKTNYGVHKDKFLFLDNNKMNIENSFSQGQKRTVALSLKLAQYDFFTEHFKRKPILLVDDVIRELDQYRRKYFLSVLLNCGQAFFTTPSFEEDMKIFKEIKAKSSKIFEISKGKLINVI